MKPVFLRSKSFIVTDHRRGKDYDDPAFPNLIATFKKNAEALEELVSFILNGDEFKTSPFVKTIDFQAIGTRVRKLGCASRSQGYIQITPQRADYHEGIVMETLVHELGHIVTPAEYQNGRRIAHGYSFKANTYKIAQYAFAVGLLNEDQVRWDLGKASLKNMDEAARTTTTSLRVGDMIAWKHNGHKYGGSYTGRVSKINAKTFKVQVLTKNGNSTPFGETWRFTIGNTGFTKLNEAEAA
jgi:hypothetical protein